MNYHVITIANQNKAEFKVASNLPLLDSLENHKLSLPYGCRYGGCISCAAKLISGKVDVGTGVALNKRQLNAGYILLCVAKPRSDCTLNIGVDSHDMLYENPFMKPPKNWLGSSANTIRKGEKHD